MALAPDARPNADRICNLVPSRNTEPDLRIADALQAGAFRPPPALPASVDLRAPWWPVSDQENTGSCVGWGSTDGVARYMFVKAGRLPSDMKLSARFTWMGSKETDAFTARPETMIESAGTTLKAAVDVLHNFGAVPETELPFHIATTMYTGDENAFFNTAATRRIKAYYNLGRNLPDWKSWLAAHGPVLVGLNVDHTWDNATATGGNLDAFQPSTVRGGHAVALVGYHPDGRFIVRNSWGTGWGANGFGFASEAYVNAAFYAESYGVAL